VNVQGTTPSVKAPALTATLSTIAAEPAPVAGQTIEFLTTSSARTPDTVLCTAETDESGVASCTPANDAVAEVLTGKGFVARLGGAGAYRAAVSIAPLVQVNTTKVPAP
jgi:hypothetical protein